MRLADLQLTSGRTPYAVLGEWVPLAAFATLFVAALWVGLRRAHRGESTD